VAFSSSVMAATQFDNGSFETGAFTQFVPGVDFDRESAGSSDLTGWTISNGVDWVGTYWKAADGSKSIDLDASEQAVPGAISQTFNTSVNSTYVVTYSLSGNPDSGPAEKTMTVDIDNGSSDETYNESYNTSTNSTTRENMNWVTKTYSFVAKTTETALTFTSTTTGGYGPVLDNIVITETLATGANCKKGGWESMVDKNGTSFRNQGDCVSYYATGEKNLAY